ncbi:hypothetical protein [Hydrogenovibrio kuenenii]|uniref:hypothetical protein n=1 Tax=Hydrogenovibrio kuenenii TaxID=63658 RepID=UPI0004676E58|nr:hypothetical protein [Hydrogenovibrio kuenenii]
MVVSCKVCKRLMFIVLTIINMALLAMPAKADSVNLSPLEITLGEPVTLILKGKNIENDFTKFDKSKIRQHFEIYDVDGDSDYMRLVLYPRIAGDAKFPAIHIGGLQFDGAVVKVNPNPDVTINWQRPKDHAYINQLQSWKALVKTSDPGLGARLLLHSHANDKVTHIFKETALDANQKWFGNQRVFQMLVGGGEPGKLKVRTPIVEVRNTGNGRPWLFFDNTLWLQLKPTPSFLPVAMPIGKVSVQVQKLSFWQIQNQMIDWKMILKGENVNPNTLPDPTAQFAYNRAIEWLMPDMQKEQRWTDTGLVSERVIKQPLRFLALGLVRLPNMRVTYFDPLTGKLVDQYVQGQWIFSVPKVVYWLINILFYALIGFALLVLVWIFIDAWYKLRLVVAIKRAESTDEVWQALLSWTASQFGQGAQNLSFGQWESKMSAHYGSYESLHELTKALDRDRFSPLSADTQTLALVWAKQVPVFKWQRVYHRFTIVKLKLFS